MSDVSVLLKCATCMHSDGHLQNHCEECHDWFDLDDTFCHHALVPLMAHPDGENARPGWDDYFLGIARAVSTRASCPRASVGAVIVRDNRILATGYNGAPSGEPHCLEAGCLLEDGHCQRSLHAEVNAVVHATASLQGARLYLWSDPVYGVCRECTKVLKAAGVEW